MPIKIRQSTPKDFAALHLLIHEFALFQQTPEKVTITLDQMVADAELFSCFVAETDQQQIIGFASFYFAYYSWSGKAIYLDDLYVTQEYRKQGIGKQLLEAVIQFAKEKKCSKIRWQVSGWNKNAIDFYKSLGAVIDDVEINCDLKLDSI